MSVVDVRTTVHTRENAVARREEILAQVGDPAAFRRRGEAFELNAEELALYSELLDLEYLLDD